ncbi:MAG: YfhO family protein [Lachnospiraceae bacterium]|nr:YfhO family protein [Lachnospiraceae bacterium]
MKNKRKYLLYVILYLFIIMPIVIRFSLDKQAAFGGWDAVNQMYPTALYIKRCFTEFLSNLSHGQFSFPMFGYTLGLGEDIIATLNYYGFGDPFYLLFLFFEDNMLPYVYTAIFYFKILLGGLSFILVAFEIDNSKNDNAYIFGALIYSFTGFTLHCNMFIIFTHAMYCIPLVIYGAEKNIKATQKGILTLSTFLFALSGFFFLYVGSITLAVYVLYKLASQRISLKKSLHTIGNLLIEYLLGIGMSCVFFLPVLYSFFTSNRTNVSNINISLFSKELFINLFKNIFIPQYNSSFQVLSLVSVGVICLLVLFTSHSYKKHRYNLIILLLLTSMPVINRIMSGFFGSYDRWVIVVIFYIAFLAVQIYDELFHLKSIQTVAITFPLILLIYIGRSCELLDNRRYYITLVSYTIIWFTLVIVIPLLNKLKYSYTKQLIQLLFLVVCTYSIHICWKENYLDKPIDSVQQREVISELINDKDFFRVDNAVTYLEPGTYPNIAFLQNYNGISNYYSISNSYFTNTMQQWNVSPHITSKITNRGLDNRATLETLCGVKYMVVPSNENVQIPYGFDFHQKTADGKWSLYRNSEFLPIMYGYRSIADYKLDNLDGFSIQALISQMACLDSYDGKLKKINNKEVLNSYINDIISIQNTDSYKDSIHLQAGDELHFNMKLLPNCENYILIKHLDVGNLFEIYENKTLVSKASVLPEHNNGYIGMNLGCVDHETLKEYTIKVSADDQITLQLINYDYSSYHDIISELRIDMSNLSIETNCISAQVNLQDPRMLCLSLPYSAGWSAKVDGKEVDIYRINSMFMGIDVDEGKHEIIFSYCTPGIKIAFLITIFSTLITFYIINKSNREI